MEEEKGFTVRDRRRVKMETDSAETEGQQGTAEAAGRRETETGGGSAGAARKPPLPPVDFPGFLIGLAQMALVHLGEVPEPQGGSREADLEQARHTIDLLDLLEEKTRGNLSSDEEQLLRHLRSDLKLRFVRAASGSAGRP